MATAVNSIGVRYGVVPMPRGGVYRIHELTFILSQENSAGIEKKKKNQRRGNDYIFLKWFFHHLSAQK